MTTRQVLPTVRRIEELRLKDLYDDADATPAFNALKAATPAEIDAFVDANINTMADVRRVLKVMLRCLVYLWRRGA